MTSRRLPELSSSRPRSGGYHRLQPVGGGPPAGEGSPDPGPGRGTSPFLGGAAERPENAVSPSELLSRLDALRARIASSDPLPPPAWRRMAHALGQAGDAAEGPGAPPETPEDLVARRALREGGEPPRPGRVGFGGGWGGAVAPPPTPEEEQALHLVRDALERIAALHRQRDVRPYELSVSLHPPTRLVELQVQPGPRPSPVTRASVLVLRATAAADGISLAVEDGGGRLYGRATLAGNPRSWQPADIDAFVVRAVDGFLDRVFAG